MSDLGFCHIFYITTRLKISLNTEIVEIRGKRQAVLHTSIFHIDMVHRIVYIYFHWTDLLHFTFLNGTNAMLVTK